MSKACVASILRPFLKAAHRPRAFSTEISEAEVLAKAFAMPLHSPAYTTGPFTFVNREYLIISIERTQTRRAGCTLPRCCFLVTTLPILQLRRLIPQPLELAEAVVNYEFISMPDSTGFGSYCESGQVIPVKLGSVRGNFGE